MTSAPRRKRNIAIEHPDAVTLFEYALGVAVALLMLASLRVFIRLVSL